MVKLIRVTSENVDGSVDSIFNSDILIKKDSQIALKNMTLETDKENLIIDGENDNMSFSLNTQIPAFTKNITLTHNSSATPFYDETNYKVLLDDMENKLNQELEITNQGTINTNKEFGSQFKVSVNTNSRIQIETKQSQYNNKKIQLVNNIPNITLQAGGTGQALEATADLGNPVFSKLDGETGTIDNRYMTYLNTPMGRGASLYRSKVSRLDVAGTGNPLNEGFIVGLTTTNPSSYLKPAVFMSDAQISYGVHLADKTANYSTIKDGTFTATTTAGQVTTSANNNNDVIEWIISGGNIECRLFQNSTGATPTTLFTEAYDYVNKPKLYPFMIIRGARDDTNNFNVRLAGLKFCLDPYLETPTADTGDEELGVPQPPQRAVNPLVSSNNFFDFKSKSVSQYLGFENNRIPVTGTNRQTNLLYIADNTFNSLDQTSNYLLILDSINLDSYDDYSDDDSGGQRKSILATIPNTGNSLAYEPNNLTYIDIKNVSNISLRNFRSRILRSDYGGLRSVGLFSMTLLIKEKGEMV